MGRKRKKPAPESGLFVCICRRSPNLPHTFACSTIGPARLNFRVRDGNGWDPRGMVTGKLGVSGACAPGTKLERRLAGGFSHGRPGSGQFLHRTGGRQTGVTTCQPGSIAGRASGRKRNRKGCTRRDVGCLCAMLRRVNSMDKPNGRLVLVSCTHCCAFTSSLSTRWSSWALQGDLILGRASRLYAFSGYHNRTSLPSRAIGMTTGTQEVRPSRSSRTKDSPPQISYAHSR